MVLVSSAVAVTLQDNTYVGVSFGKVAGLKEDHDGFCQFYKVTVQYWASTDLLLIKNKMWNGFYYNVL